MFACPKCKGNMALPVCDCGYIVEQRNNIWQLSDKPDIITDGDGDKYIGYEYIGENYSGNRKYLIEERDSLFAQEVANQTGNGIVLDLACGDGRFTVPCASYGTKIIAGDISNTMLSILQKKAEYNNSSLKDVTLCRMNALEIPLESESIDTVVANSVLHLISNPEKVIAEIYRVLKIGGKFICVDDKPGRNPDDTLTNASYNEIVNTMYHTYWNILKGYGITPKKYSWRFDREASCNNLFKSKEKRLIERENCYEITLKDGFLPRFSGRGFSDQVDVPKDLHDHVIAEVTEEIKAKYGDDFADTVFKGIEEDLIITAYVK